MRSFCTVGKNMRIALFTETYLPYISGVVTHVKLLKDAGALEVHVRITAPPFMHPCYYGTDIDSRENLIACKHTVDEIRDIIGADSLGFLNTGFLSRLPSDDMAHGYCTACFTGVYDTDIPLVRGKDRFES